MTITANSIGPKRVPWGMPPFNLRGGEEDVAILTTCDLPAKSCSTLLANERSEIIASQSSTPGCSKADSLNPGLALTFVSCFQILIILVKASFAYFFVSRLTSSNATFCRISALNNIWELRNKLLGIF